MISPTSTTPDRLLLPHLPPLTTRAGRTVTCALCPRDAVVYRSGEEGGALCPRDAAASAVPYRIPPPARAHALAALQTARSAPKSAPATPAPAATPAPTPTPPPAPVVSRREAASLAREERRRAAVVAEREAREAQAEEERRQDRAAVLSAAVAIYRRARDAGQSHADALRLTGAAPRDYPALRLAAGEPTYHYCPDCRDRRAAADSDAPTEEQSGRLTRRRSLMCPAHAAEERDAEARYAARQREGYQRRRPHRDLTPAERADIARRFRRGDVLADIARAHHMSLGMVQRAVAREPADAHAVRAEICAARRLSARMGVAARAREAVLREVEPRWRAGETVHAIRDALRLNWSPVAEEIARLEALYPDVAAARATAMEERRRDLLSARSRAWHERQKPPPRLSNLPPSPRLPGESRGEPRAPPAGIGGALSFLPQPSRPPTEGAPP